MKKKFLTVAIRCTPLVKAYLENNFGNPVSVPDEHILNKLACSQLFKGNIRSNVYKKYPEIVSFNISEKNFKFDGFNINEANTHNFNNAVSHFIKVLYRSNLDSLLLLYDKQIDWKKKYMDLVDITIKPPKNSQEVTKIKVSLKEALKDHEFTIKKSIEHVVTTCLRLNFDILPYETIKKDYYRYREKKFSTQMSLD